MTNKFYFAAALAAAFVASNAAADTILVEDFEDTSVGYTPSVADDLSDVGNSDYYGIASAADLPSNVDYGNTQGAGFYTAQDTNGATNPVSTITLDFIGIDVSAFTNLSLSFFLAEDDSTDGFEDWDEDTSFTVQYNLDGAGFVTAFAVESEQGPDFFNEAPRVDSNLDGFGDGTEITDTFQQFAFGIMDGGLLDLRFSFINLTAADEDLALDDILLTGDAVAPVPLPAGIWLMGLALGGLGLARRKS